MARLRFHSDFQIVGDPMHAFPVDVVKNEPMLFSCNSAFAFANGGPITRHFFECMPDEWLCRTDLIWDSRVHMLMPGWFPCIPGWHLDDIPRTRPDGQPDHANPAYRADHLMAIVGDCSRTTFAVGDLELEDVPVQLEPPTIGKGIIYGEWHRDIEELLKSGASGLHTAEAPVRQIIHFNDHSFHRGTAATTGGWRWFVRVTRNTQRKVFNEIRQQTQVYLASPEAGW